MKQHDNEVYNVNQECLHPKTTYTSTYETQSKDRTDVPWILNWGPYDTETSHSLHIVIAHT